MFAMVLVGSSSLTRFAGCEAGEVWVLLSVVMFRTRKKKTAC